MNRENTKNKIINILWGEGEEGCSLSRNCFPSLMLLKSQGVPESFINSDLYMFENARNDTPKVKKYRFSQNIDPAPNSQLT